MTTCNPSNNKNSVTFIVKHAGKDQPILQTVSWPVIGEFRYSVLVDTKSGKIFLNKSLTARANPLTPLTAAKRLTGLDRQTRDQVPVPVEVTGHGDNLVSANVTIIPAAAGKPNNEETVTLFFREVYQTYRDGCTYVPYWVLQRALEAQFTRNKHNVDPTCPLPHHAGTVRRPRGRWGGTLHLARIVLDNFCAAEMGESNYSAVQSLLRDEQDT